MQTRASQDRCRACGAAPLRVFHRVERVPVHCCQLLPTREAARAAATGRLELAFCPACGFVQNSAFDPGRVDYGADYEESQAFSPRFRAFAEQLADDLARRHDLAGRPVLEIGCGKGDFLVTLCERSGCRGLGLDPSWRPGRLADPSRGAAGFRAELFAPATAPPADLVVCRHTLEHLADVRAFVESVRDALDRERDPVVFFEVPDVGRILAEQAFWDLYYEHCSYFSAGSLARLFRRCGLEPERLTRGFGDQYLLIEARRAGRSPERPLELEDDLVALTDAVERFARELPGALERCRARFEGCGRGRVVLWGAGSKAVGLLTTLGLADEVAAVVDINPHKQGMFLAGTGHPILAPEALVELRPQRVVVMNPIYTDEIRGSLHGLDLQPEVEAA